MKRPATIRLLLLLTTLALWAAGCASPNVNPSQARPNTGYVDFHADSTNELCWDVERFDDAKGSFQRVFSELKPPQSGILRLAFAPGHHKLRATFLNLVVVQPVEVQVDVQDGKISPVSFKLAEGGDALVRTKETSAGGTVYGRYGRRTKFGTDESVKYDLSATADQPVAYQPKERMPYAR